MSYIEWKDEYNIAIQEIDTQHQKLVDLINQLEESFSREDDDKLIGVALNELVNYTQHHFSSEEKYMKEINYAKLEDQIQQHETFVKALGEFLIQWGLKEKFDRYEFLLYLKEWLIDHILIEDKKILAGLCINK